MPQGHWPLAWGGRACPCFKIKVMSKKNIITAIIEAFVANPTEQVFYATEDGNVFFEKDKHAGEYHARQSGLLLKKYERHNHEAEIAEAAKPDEPKGPTAQELELQARAAAVGLPPTATEKEIKNAEKAAKK